MRSTGTLSKFGLGSLMAGCADAYGTANSVTTTMLESWLGDGWQALIGATIELNGRLEFSTVQ